MLIIILFCLSFLLVEYLSKHLEGERTQTFIQIVVCFLLLFIFFGFRDLPVLNDTAHYYRYIRHLFQGSTFDSTPWYSFDSSLNFEEGFQIFSRIIGKVFSKEPYSLIIISAFITTLSLLHFLKKATPHIAFAVFVLLTSTLIMGYYSAIRQSLAVAISYIFYYYYKNGKYRNAIISAVIAYFFHHSSVILILPVILYYIPFTRKNLIVVITVTIIAALGIYQILSYIGYGDHLYVTTGMERTAVPLAQGLDTLFVFICLLFYYIYRARKVQEWDDSDFEEDKLFVSFALSALIVNIWALSCLSLFRFSLFFSQYAVVLFINAIYGLEKGNQVKTLKSIAICVLLARFVIVLIYRNGWFHLIPYSFFDFGLEYQQTQFGY